MVPPQTRVVLVDHHDSYSTILAHLVASVTGELPRVVQHDEVGVQEVAVGPDGSVTTHVVLSPGPGHPGDRADFAVGAELVADPPVPILGVCLGLQGIVVGHGGVVQQVQPAHGLVDTVTHSGNGLFTGLPQSFDVVRYHSLAATYVPDVLEVTARGRTGTVMAVRHRELPLSGVQFHPESVLTRYGRELVAAFLTGRR
ncbi:MAG: aminodeoxychorismate/anthranilate synthase component II [Actinomycetota bacterium]|nr:aminodeoxychorismate/anthranilate synthase component II [Actinomycetota bacterium]